MGPGPFNEDSGRFPVLIDMERPEQETFFDDIAAVGEEIDRQLTCPGDAATCLCDSHVWARHEAALSKLHGRARKAARGKLLGSDFAVAETK